MCSLVRFDLVITKKSTSRLDSWNSATYRSDATKSNCCQHNDNTTTTTTCTLTASITTNHNQYYRSPSYCLGSPSDLEGK